MSDLSSMSAHEEAKTLKDKQNDSEAQIEEKLTDFCTLMAKSVALEHTTQRPKYIESQAIEIVGNDGKKHFIWARSAMDAYRDATKWSYRHGGLDSVFLLMLRDENEGCWDRAKRVPFGRQCNLATIIDMNKEGTLSAQ